LVELPLEWVEKADVLIDDAERHFREGHYWLTCFEAQQASELYLKALIVALTGTHPFTHGLAELLEALRELDISVPDELFVYADALTPHCTMAPVSWPETSEILTESSVRGVSAMPGGSSTGLRRRLLRSLREKGDEKRRATGSLFGQAS
jgi:HEPN domain-containing protein